ncbi:MAG: hypothetical protein JWN93_2900 [Hyphomicrobiales bacterium]|nr:hypothetical protein [Hyphomicrobiales bacterium]
MLHKHTKALLLATCMAAAPSFAFAQATQTQTNPPAAQTQAQRDNAAASSNAAASKAMATAQPNQMMGSDLRGARVYSSNNENIGDVNDFLVDRSGRIEALVIGVGGFLGIGEKNVALPFSSFEFVNEPMTSRTSSTREPATTGTVRSEQSPADRAAADRSAAERTTTTTTTGAPVRTTSGAMKPDHLLLKGMTKADLQNAPTFHADASRASTSTTTTTTTAPANRPAAPADTTAPRR